MKKRRIRWDRCFILLACVGVLVGALTYGVKLILAEQACNRENTYVDLQVNDESYRLNVNQFIDYKTTGVLPMVESIELEVSDDNCCDDPIIDNVNSIEYDELECLGEFRLTGYCNCEECNGIWAWGPTAYGTMPEQGRTIAVDSSVIPLGTEVFIENEFGELESFIAEDTGSAIIDRRIDIYMDNHSDCFCSYCNRYAKVYIAK